ncbi:MAG: helix-turn-helix transcriptional regulator [Rhizobiales bacterium]|nr:helix-turn-helix transcriptional regulator [Hyphomicrobiales bacterium]
MSLGEIVATNLRRIRMERGLSQEELASRVGIDRNYVGMIERQENSPTIAMIERLAKALEIPPVRLLEERKPR